MAAAKKSTAKKAKPAKTKSKDNGALQIDDVRAKTPDQLKDMLVEFKREKFNGRFQRAAGEQPKAAKSRIVRKNIAKVLTALNEKKLEQKNA